MKSLGWIGSAMMLWFGLAGCTAAPSPTAERIGTDRASLFHLRDGWLYFNNLEDQERLTRIRPDGAAREILSDLPRAMLLGFDGAATYFGVFRYENGPQHDWTIDELYRIPAEGAPAEQVAEVSISRLNPGFIAAGTSIFFNGGDANQPASMRLDTASGQIETLSTIPIQQAERGPNGSVYLSREGDTGGIERWDSGATAAVPVFSEPVMEFAVEGDGLYFVSTRDLANLPKKRLGCLYRIPAAGGTPVRLDAGGAAGIQVSGDWIYYTRGWGPLIRTRTDGSKTETLHTGIVLNPLLAGDWIYFTRGSPLEAFSSKLGRVRTDGSRSETLLKARAYFVDAGPGWACYRTVDDDRLLRMTVSE